MIPGMLYAQFVRSTMAHARVISIDTSAATASPGVVAVLTNDDLELPQVFFPAFAQMLAEPHHRPALAGDTVRFVGEGIALVVAETAAAAEDAVELVDVELEPLPAVADPALAASDGAPLLFPSLGTNVALTVPFEAGERPAGDAVQVHVQVNVQRVAVAPMEGNAIVAIPEADTGRTTLYLSTQFPHIVRDLTASFLGIEPGDLRVVCPAVGGGFGGKSPIEPDYVVVAAAARHLGRPVRWVQSRLENLMAMHGRGHIFDVTLEAFADGRLVSLQVDALTDVGAYPGVGVGMIMTCRGLATGAYRIPHVRFDVRCVATNTAPTGPFRGAGRPEAAELIERAMDVLAAELGIDPVELRRRNLIPPGRVPLSDAHGQRVRHRRVRARARHRAGARRVRRAPRRAGAAPP